MHAPSDNPSAADNQQETSPQWRHQHEKISAANVNITTALLELRKKLSSGEQELASLAMKGIQETVVKKAETIMRVYSQYTDKYLWEHDYTEAVRDIQSALIQLKKTVEKVLSEKGSSETTRDASLEPDYQI